MPSDKEELAQRLSRVSSDDTVRGLVFNAILAEMEERLGKGPTDPFRRRIAKRGLVDFFSYPATDFLRLIFEAADLLEAQVGPPEECFRRFGARSVHGFLDSAIGKTLISIVGRGDPKRLFASAPTSYSTTVSYGKRTYQAVSKTSCKLHFEGDMQPPTFHVGVLEDGLRAVGCQGQVSFTSRGLDEVEYFIEWS